MHKPEYHVLDRDDLAHVWQESQEPCSLDGRFDLALVMSTIS